MPEKDDNLTNQPHQHDSNRRRIALFLGLLALLAPLSYIAGRFSAAAIANQYLKSAAALFATIALGACLGIPIGLFFGALKQPEPVPPHRPLVDEHEILMQIQHELGQIKSMFEARKGNNTVVARISYPTEFWDAIKASGQLFVMSDPRLLNVIGSAYYWTKQANHIEGLAYEAQGAAPHVADDQNIPTHLVTEARLLDGALETALDAAIAAIGSRDPGPLSPPMTGQSAGH